MKSPLTSEDAALFGPPPGRPLSNSYVDAMVHLEESGQLVYRDERWLYTSKRYPAQDVGLRSAGSQRIVLMDAGHGNQVLEEIDAATATFRVHQGAIYLHQGATYLVTDLDLQAGVAHLKAAEVDYYTQPRELNDVRIIRSVSHRQLPSGTVFHGQVRITTQVVGYSRRKQFSDEVLSQEPLDMPPQTFETTAVWWEVQAELVVRSFAPDRTFLGVSMPVEHACIGILPLLAMCDRMDLGGVSSARHIDTEGPLVCVYDAYPGGVGLSERGFEVLEEWWAATLEAIRSCPCVAGLPLLHPQPQVRQQQ